MFAVEGEGEAVLLLFQFDMTLFHCLLQRYLGLKYGLNTLTHMERGQLGLFIQLGLIRTFILSCSHTCIPSHTHCAKCQWV